MKLVLEQRGDEITGEYSHLEKSEQNSYDIRGNIRDMYFIATAIPKSNRTIDCAAFIMHIETITHL